MRFQGVLRCGLGTTGLTARDAQSSPHPCQEVKTKMPTTTRTRPGTMRLADALQYRLPLAGVVSILHRASGAMMFALLPFVVWLFDVSLSSEVSYERFTSAFALGIGFVWKGHRDHITGG